MASLASQADLILYAGGNTTDVPDTVDVDEEVLQVSRSLDQEELERLWNVEPSLYEKIVSESLFKIPLMEEGGLFTPREINIVLAYDRLSYEARYFLIRHVLRKQQWHRESVLVTKYRAEIGDKAKACVKELTRQISPIKDDEIKLEEPEIVVLTAGTGLSFCLDQDALTLPEALDILSLDELKALSKQFKQPPHGTRESLVTNLLNSSEKQTTITSFFNSSVKASPKSKKCINKESPQKMRQTTLNFGSPSKNATKSTQHRLLCRCKEILGICMKIRPEVMDLFTKAHLVFFRSTCLPESLLLPALLALFKKRNHPQIEATRSSMLTWPSSRVFDEYWGALRVLEEVENILSYNDPIFRPVKSKPSGKFKQKSVEDITEEVLHDPKSLTAAKMVWNIVKKITPKWWNMVLERKGSEDQPVVRTGLERFDPGYILTRVMHKGADACGRLKEYQSEVRILNALLEQPYWRQRKKGAWYDRLALVLTKTWKDIKPSEEVDEELALSDLPPFNFKTQPQATKLAYATVRRGLSDERTTRVYIPKLVARLQRIERKLKVKEEDKVDVSQYKELKRATETYMEADRVWDDVPPPGQLNKEGRMVNADKTSTNSLEAWTRQSPVVSTNYVIEPKSRKWELPWKGKSLWKGRDGTVVNVEELVVQFYEGQGFRGLHAETRILTTLFGLLFFDILFMQVDGAFETVYQTAPLDLVEESFYYARREVIEERLEAIRGVEKAIELLRVVDDAEREKKTWCVGVRWDFCTQDDLVEIIQCMGGETLSTICRLFAEDYAGRTSGGPDLIVWDIRLKACRFVEVKGPGDDLMENQKVWIDALLRAGADVQVFHVVETGMLDRKRRLIKTEEEEGGRGRKRQKVESEDTKDGILLDPKDAGHKPLIKVKVEQDNDIKLHVRSAPPTLPSQPE